MLPFLQSQPQLPESRAVKCHMMLKFAYQKKCSPTPFFFLYVWTVFGRVPESQPLLVLVVPQFLIRVRPPASSHHAHEGKQSWHVSLMRSRAQSVGKELCFHTHYNSAASTKELGQAAQPLFNLNTWLKKKVKKSFNKYKWWVLFSDPVRKGPVLTGSSAGRHGDNVLIRN